MAWLRVLFVLLLMTSSALADDGVNAVIGDESWVARFGAVPDASADEDLRLRVHLEYVEARLRASPPVGLTEAQLAQRARHLDHLRAYIARGEFPRNHEVAGRRPHFIDDDGRICAVGYLIEQSEGRAVAEAINVRHEWDFIPSIRGIDAWVEASGLTARELAMIQPSYNWQRPVRPPPPPPDERMIQRRVIIAALGTVHGDVQRCAARFETWSDGVDVTVRVLSRGRFDIAVSHDGGRGFRRCVHSEVAAAIASSVGRSGRVFPMTVSHAFAIDLYEDERFAQPPPY